MTQAMIDECVGLVIKHALVALPLEEDCRPAVP